MSSETPSNLRNSKIISKISRLANNTTTSTRLPIMENPENEQTASHISLAESHKVLEGNVDFLKEQLTASNLCWKN